jgi:hypothetical protein
MDTYKSASDAAQYKTFLLTCWLEVDEVMGTAVWRFRLETPRSGEQHLFTTFKDVMTLIEKDLDN